MDVPSFYLRVANILSLQRRRLSNNCSSTITWPVVLVEGSGNGRLPCTASSTTAPTLSIVYCLIVVYCMSLRLGKKELNSILEEHGLPVKSSIGIVKIRHHWCVSGILSVLRERVFGFCQEKTFPLARVTATVAWASWAIPLLIAYCNMSALKQVMQVIGSHPISNQLLESDCDKSAGLISNSEYAWFAAGANLVLYSKQFGSIVSSRSFAVNQKDKSLTVSRATTTVVLKTTE